MGIQVQELIVYPVKSLPGIRVHQTRVNEEGLLYDRRWMLVDDSNNFISLRTEPILYRVKQRLNEELGVIELEAHIGSSTLDLHVNTNCSLSQATIWRDNPSVIHLGNSDFFSELLGKKTGVCYIPPMQRRRIAENNKRNFFVGFADAYPVLILSAESVQYLYGNNREETWIRFRPNILLSGCEPFQEDGMKLISGDEVQIETVNQCVRCNVPPINPFTLEIDKPIAKVLNSMRKTPHGVVLGMNALVNRTGMIKKGEALYAG